MFGSLAQATLDELRIGKGPRSVVNADHPRACVAGRDPAAHRGRAGRATGDDAHRGAEASRFDHGGDALRVVGVGHDNQFRDRFGARKALEGCDQQRAAAELEQRLALRLGAHAGRGAGGHDDHRGTRFRSRVARMGRGLAALDHGRDRGQGELVRA